MNWLGITQRVNVNGPFERYDAVDQRWNQIALDLGFTPIHLPNIAPEHVVDLFQSLNPSAILLTGGNSLISVSQNAINAAPERDHFEHALLKIAIENRIPVLGICRGMQLINEYYGGTIERIDGHAGTKHAIRFHDELSKFGTVNINSYHDWGISPKSVSKKLNILATTLDGMIEAVKHSTDKVTGIMWHPEREMHLTEYDKQLLENALK